jgi:hypothetical protein
MINVYCTKCTVYNLTHFSILFYYKVNKNVNASNVVDSLSTYKLPVQFLLLFSGKQQEIVFMETGHYVVKIVIHKEDIVDCEKLQEISHIITKLNCLKMNANLFLDQLYCTSFRKAS